MSDPEIFVKTDAGTEEVKARSRKLPPRLRTMLIMVDGSLSVDQLRDAAATLGAPGDFLQALQEQGLIRRREAAAAAELTVDLDLGQPAQAVTPTDGERFRTAQKFMNDSAVDSLGLRAILFTLKLEKAFTVADLRALLPDYVKVITKGSGDDAARVMGKRARDLLA
jgi:hypothetical protein